MFVFLAQALLPSLPPGAPTSFRIQSKFSSTLPSHSFFSPSTFPPSLVWSRVAAVARSRAARLICEGGRGGEEGGREAQKKEEKEGRREEGGRTFSSMA